MKTPIALALILLFVTGTTAPAATPGAPTVAVYDFTDTGRDARGFGKKVTALVTADLTAETNLVLLARAELDQALSEQAFGISGLVSSDAAAKIGQLTGAQVLVSGQVLMTTHDHAVIIANIIGTDTGRLFAAKVEGATDNLTGLTTDLSAKIAATVAQQTTNLITAAEESSAARQDRIVKSLKGAKRPLVSVSILWPTGRMHSNSAETEFGAILLKAGFPVVDANSERKPDVEIKGLCDHGEGPRRGELYTYRTVIELKVQQRRTGDLITIDRQESFATDATKVGADRSSQVEAADRLAERVLPLLAQ